MSKNGIRYTDEFKQQIVDLYVKGTYVKGVCQGDVCQGDGVTVISTIYYDG